MENTGSFGGAAGGISPDLRAAMQQRVGQGGTTQQVTQGSPNATPMPPPPQGNPQMVPSAPTGGQGGSSQRVDDAHIILKAMAGRLKSQEKIAEARMIPPKLGA